MKKPNSVQAITERLFNVFQHVMPLHPIKSKSGKRISDKDIRSASESALNRFYEVAREERQRYRLGLIGRARVAFSLQQRLLAVGYAPELVKQVLFSMLISAFVGDKH